MSTDELEARARVMLQSLLNAGDRPPSMIEALHDRWSKRGLGNSVLVESPAHPDGWVVTLVTPGWPRATRHVFEEASFNGAALQAMRWLDEVRND